MELELDTEYLKPGIYRHFKGGVYFIEGVASHTETGEQFVTYYNSDGQRFVRPITMFTEYVIHEGKQQLRFFPVMYVDITKISMYELLVSTCLKRGATHTDIKLLSDEKQCAEWLYQLALRG